jgi:hypothetical protein
MLTKTFTIGATSLLTLAMAASASAESIKSKVAFNTGIGEETADQPADGKTVAYQITLDGGDLDGCTVDVVESLFGREEGAWGIFDVAGDVTCANGGFAYTSSGTWDGNGFHAAGAVNDGSGTGDFDGIQARIAHINGAGSDAGDGTFDIAYELVVDKAEN